MPSTRWFNVTNEEASERIQLAESLSLPAVIVKVVAVNPEVQDLFRSVRSFVDQETHRSLTALAFPMLLGGCQLGSQISGGQSLPKLVVDLIEMNGFASRNEVAESEKEGPKVVLVRILKIEVRASQMVELYGETCGETSGFYKASPSQLLNASHE